MSNEPELSEKTNRPSWFQYFLAANRTGGGSFVMLLVGLAVGFPWGYYVKYKSFKSHGVEIVTQALNNERLDDESEKQMQQRSTELTNTLVRLGFTESELDYLLKGNISTLDKLKSQVNSYFNNGELYLPREDCDDDYLGREASDEINKHILERFDKSKDGGENE